MNISRRDFTRYLGGLPMLSLMPNMGKLMEPKKKSDPRIFWATKEVKMSDEIVDFREWLCCSTRHPSHIPDSYRIDLIYESGKVRTFISDDIRELKSYSTLDRKYVFLNEPGPRYPGLTSISYKYSGSDKFYVLTNVKEVLQDIRINVYENPIRST